MVEVQLSYGVQLNQQQVKKSASHKIFGKFISVVRINIEHFICVTEELQL